ncbi:MAG: hypothetical protein ACKVQC_01110 [Elusimicrobiota bacterium]
MKKKKIGVGANFYKTQDLVPIVVHVPKEIREALNNCAQKERRSLQQTVRLILEQSLERGGGV